MNYKSALKGFPEAIVNKMLDYQEKQGNPRNIAIFEETPFANRANGGFDYELTEEGSTYWQEVVVFRNFTYDDNTNLK